jgi:hypothetical protein
MPVLNPACAEHAADACNSQPAPAELAERCLRSNPYLALKNVSCDCLDGVLVLRGCLPTYYLKQIAQEIVAHQVRGLGRLDNQIQVVRAVVLETPPDQLKVGVLDVEESCGQSHREASPDSDRRAETAVKVLAPFGEEIEVER